MKIAIDFDGTCVTHEFPKIGQDIGAVPVLKKLVENGHQLILFTMRSDDESMDRNFLTAALQWFALHKIELYGIQKDPEQEDWTSSNKAYAQMYIDDAALGCPLHYPLEGRPYVDWTKIVEMLKIRGIL